MKRFSKYIALLAALVTVVSALCGCSNKLSPAFSESRVLETGRNAVSMLCSEDYAGLTAIMTETTALELTENALKSAFDTTVGQAGSASDITVETCVGQTDKATGEDYAVAIIVVEFSSGVKYRFDISMNAEYMIMGLWIKNA